MNIDELTGGRIPAEENDEVIVDPNVARAMHNGPTGEVKSVDPIKLRGLKTQADIDAEHVGTEFDRAIDIGHEALKKQKEQLEVLKDTAEQTDDGVDSQTLERVYGFDPLAMMQTPPDPTKPVAAKKPEPVEEAIPVVEETKVAQESNDEADIEKELNIPVSNTVSDIRESASHVAAGATQETAPEKSLSSEVPEVNQDDIDAEMRELDEELSKAEAAGTSMFTEDERAEYLKQDIRSKIKPIANKFDISSFTVVKKPTLVNRTLEKAEKETKSRGRVADWVLPSTKRRISVSGMLGTEISEFTSRSSRNDVESVRARFEMLYKHDITPNKAPTMEQWAKSISRNDYDHLFAAYYRACFENSNFIPYECDNDRCQSSFLSENIPFMNIVKFANEEARKDFNDILNDKHPGDPSLYVSEVTPVSDVYAMSFKEPSLYDSFIKPAYIDREFINKYSDAFTMSAFIDEIYYIDMEAQELRPIDILKYPGNIAKSEKAKIMIIAKILSTLTSDQYSMMLSILGSIGEDKGGITYIMPEAICPRCGHKIEEQEISASNLLFLRHQLATLANG